MILLLIYEQVVMFYQQILSVEKQKIVFVVLLGLQYAYLNIDVPATCKAFHVIPIIVIIPFV